MTSPGSSTTHQEASKAKVAARPLVVAARAVHRAKVDCQGSAWPSLCLHTRVVDVKLGGDHYFLACAVTLGDGSPHSGHSTDMCQLWVEVAKEGNDAAANYHVPQQQFAAVKTSYARLQRR